MWHAPAFLCLRPKPDPYSDLSPRQVARKACILVPDVGDGRITCLILQKGHPWGQKKVVILVSEIERIKENIVRLKLNKRQIGTLPAVPVRRKWLERARSIVSSVR
jgi:hypothetical protein